MVLLARGQSAPAFIGGNRRLVTFSNRVWPSFVGMSELPKGLASSLGGCGQVQRGTFAFCAKATHSNGPSKGQTGAFWGTEHLLILPIQPPFCRGWGAAVSDTPFFIRKGPFQDFPDSPVVKNLPCNTGDID